MTSEKRYYLIGNKDGLKKTIAAFKLHQQRIVIAITKPPDTIQRTTETYTEHFTYHKTGQIDHTIEKNNKPIFKENFKHLSPIESINDPEFLLKGWLHYLDFQGMDIKCFDKKIAHTSIIELSTKGSNYLGFHIKIWIAGKQNNTKPKDFENGELHRLCGDGPQVLLSIELLDGMKKVHGGFEL